MFCSSVRWWWLHAVNNGVGAWREIDAPVTTPGVDNAGCRNFSPTLVVLGDDRSLLEISTDFDGGVCKAYYGTGPIA